MNTKIMKMLDCYAGIPICLLLDLVNKLLLPWPSRRFTKPDKILLMKFFGMGSILLATPLLRELRAKYPAATIGFLTFAANREIIDRIGLVDNIYVLRTDTLLHFSGDLFKILWQIRNARYDVTIDMEFFAKFSTIMTYLSGSPMRIGYFLRQLWRGDLLTHQIYYNQFKHISEIFAALAEPLGVKVTDYHLAPPVTTSVEEASALRMLQEHAVTEKELLVVFNVNASDLSVERRWDENKFQALANAMLTELRAKLVFIGGRSEKAFVDCIVAGIYDSPDIINLAGKTSLGELLCVLKQSNLLITNDSGPLHLAAALGIPTVSFFGPESPTLYGPKGGDALVFYEGIYCSPCLNVFNVKTAPCAGENICMRAISQEAVLEAMRQHFSSTWVSFGKNQFGSIQRQFNA